MGKASWEDVILRALGTGAVMGALGGTLLAAVLAVAPPSYSPVSDVLMLIGIGGVIGAVIGVGCAIPAGLILAAGRHFLSRHQRIAQVYGGIVGGVLLASLVVAGYGWTAAGPDGPVSSGWLIAAAFGLGLAVSGFNVTFVVTGRQCLVARCLARGLARCVGRR